MQPVLNIVVAIVFYQKKTISCVHFCTHMLGTSSRTTLSKLACMHPILRRTHLLSPFVTFCSVGLGSYLRAHTCHSYPGPSSCRSHLISLSCLSLPQCSRSVRLGLCLFVSLMNIVRPDLFPLSIVMSGEYVVVLFILNIGARQLINPRP